MDGIRPRPLPPAFPWAGSWEESNQELGEDLKSVFQYLLASCHPQLRPTPCNGEVVLATIQAMPECSISPAQTSEGNTFLQGSGAKTKSRAWRSAPATLGCQRSTMKTTRGPSSGEPRAHGDEDSRAADIKYLYAGARTKYS